jgi:ribulose-bisphosphate carboxylase large chain
LAYGSDGGTTLWLANLSAEPETVAIAGANGACTRLEVEHFDQAVAAPDWFETAPEAQVEGQLELGAYASRASGWRSSRMGARIRASYLIETGLDVAAAAQVMAGEQSSGTFVAIPGETPELRARAGARVEAIEELERVSSPSLPGAAPAADGTYTRARVELSWPLENLGPSLPNLVATVAGNLFELRQFSGLRLLDIKLPDAFASAYPGPAFGVEGTRRVAGVDRRPLIGTIIKPSVGLDAAQTAELVDELCAAGIDFIKDDELQADGPHCPFEARVKAVAPVLRRHADRAGRQVMFAFNVTGEIDEMRRRHDLVLEHGGTCVMASLNSVGLTGFTALRRHAVLPIHAHRNGWGYLSRHPMLGWSYIAWQKLWRLAGAPTTCMSTASTTSSARTTTA